MLQFVFASLDVTFHDHPAIAVSIPKDAVNLAGDKDGALLRVAIQNDLPCVCCHFCIERC